MKRILILTLLLMFTFPLTKLYAGCRTLSLNAGNWENPNIARGYSYQGYELQTSTSGLYMPGAPWQNGCRNNVCDGNYAATIEKFNFQNGGELYIAFTPNGGGQYMWLSGTVEGLPYIPMSTDHSWNGSYVISDSAELFIHIKINADRTYSFTLSSGNYDDNGGTVLQTLNDTLSDTQYQNIADVPVRIWLGDNYAGTAANMTVNEVKVCIDNNDSNCPDSCTNSDCEATYDLPTSILTIPCLTIDSHSYWLKLRYLHNGSFTITDAGENN